MYILYCVCVYIYVCMYIYIYLCTTIIRHELGLDRPVLALSNSLSQGLPSRLRLFGL